MSEHDDDHTAPWDPALGRRKLLRAGGAWVPRVPPAPSAP